MEGGSAVTEGRSQASLLRAGEGLAAELTLLGDSSACSGTLHREGTGKVKHLELKQLWLQQKICGGEIDYKKISRDDNPADSLCKAWSKDGVRHFKILGFYATGVQVHLHD